MRKIIDGKLYDTETAMEVGSSSHGCQIDFNYYEETLYRKRNGEYFLAGYGNALSKYRVQVGVDRWDSGSAIFRMSFDEARKWAEDNLSVEDYMEEFELVESDDDVTITVRVKDTTKKMLRRLAFGSDRSQGQVIDELVAKAFNERRSGRRDEDNA